MTETLNLALPRIEAAQAQKHVTHNEALQKLDALVHLSVAARDALAPPATPVEGQRLLIGQNAAGAFAGKDFQIAAFLDGAWVFLAPKAGWRAFVEAEKLLLAHNGAQWVDVGALIRSLQNLTTLGLGTTADAANPLSAKLNAALFTARAPGEGGAGDLRFVLNKSAAGNTASQIYQTNYSGRAETGLAGDDRFRIKVSDDGANWREALSIDPATGAVSMPATSLAPFDAMASLGLQINGAMEVSQANGANAVAGANGYVLDGWQVLKSGAGVVSAQQVTDAPPGFSNSLRVSVTTAQATLAAGDYLVVQQPIEGVRTARLGFGVASAAPVAIGFFFKSAIAGNFYVSLRNGALNRAHVRRFACAAANVWQWVVMTFPGDVAGSWSAGTGVGLCVSVALAAGSGLQGTVNAWQAANLLAGADQTNGFSTLNASFQLSGFCVFPGTQAPAMADAWKCRPQFDDELRRSQRYLRVLRAGAAAGVFGGGLVGATTAVWRIKIDAPAAMRAAPTLTQQNCSVNDGSGWRAVTALTNFSSADILCFDAAIGVAGLTVGRAALFGDAGANTAALIADARL